ncbi:MAG: hypothetical protein EHM58_03540 [Ignavibacteriae bacterium]|nr:MAG: hypothetical protein EHM58_03540 [Ignavibacteriota bacterium]
MPKRIRTYAGFVFMMLLALLTNQEKASAQLNNDAFDINSSFSIYTNNYYSSTQDVSITINAYSIKKKAEFNFKIYKIKDVEGFFSRQTSTYSIDVLSKDSLNLLYMCEEVDEFNKTMKTEGYDDYYYSYETVTYKPKQKGAFLVRVSYKNKVAYAGYFVTDLGMITEAGSNALLSYTLDRISGDPLSDVNLSFYLGNKKIGDGKTVGGLFYKGLNEDDRDFAAKNNISYPLAIAKNGEDVAVSDPYLYFGYGANKYSVYIYTNQPVYRPQSIVNFKGTIRKSGAGEFNNFASQDVTVSIKDSKSAEVFKKVLRTNSNGSFDGEFNIEKDAPLGVYYIYATIEEGQAYTGNFKVEEYKKPEYKVGITVEKDQYTDGESIKGIIQADYYFGSPVQDAKVEYNVYKQTFYKPWWYFSEYRWWYEEYYASQDDNQRYNNADFIYSGSGELNKDGRFDFEYAIKEDFKAKYNYYYYWWDSERSYETDFVYIIQAKVTDKSRREISSTKTVYVTRAGFYLTSSTDKYLYKPGETVTVQVRSNDFADKPVAIGFSGTVNSITWGKYPDYKQEKHFITTFSGNTKADGLGSATFESKDEGYYEIEVSAFDDRGKKVTTESYCYVSTGDMWWWYNQSGTVQIIPEKESYKPGELCKALIITTTPGANVLITTQNDNILTYKVEKIDGTSKILEIPVESNSAPNFYISASYVKEGNFYSGNKSVMVIPEAKFLEVAINTDKPTYKPKEEGTVQIKVTDKFGNPVSNAEVSIGIVDESIYAIAPDNTKDVRQFFYAPKLSSVNPQYSNSYSFYGYSRMISIYERFNVKNLGESELGTIKGRITDKSGNAVQYATIVIDGDFVAGTTGENGEFEFKLPEGSYNVSVLQGKKTKDSEQELSVRKGQTITVNLKADADGYIMSDQEGAFEQPQMQRSLDYSSVMLDEISNQSGRTITESEEIVLDGKNHVKKESKGDDKDTPDFIDAELRSDFKDAILWSPSVTTDENGYAVVNIKYPDNLTTWRITSRVITEDTKVGQMTNTVITRKDLLVRMETPRFFQQKDEVTISTIIHNYLSEDKTTKISLKGENIELIGDNAEKTITMAKNEEKRIDWRVKVTNPDGFAKLTATALTNQESDAVEMKVPLQPHGLKLDQYLAMDISEVNRTDINEVKIPDYTDMRSTKLELNVAPSLASTMLTALDELVGYPYGCVEQTMSRFLPTIVVADAFHELNAPISDATKKDLPKMVESGFNRLYSMQHYDGGWGWWTNDQSHPFMTSYVIYGLALAQTAGYNVRKDVLGKGVASLKTQLRSSDIDATTRAYMIYSLSFVDTKDTKLFQDQFKILSDEKKLNDYAIGLISLTASNIGDKETANHYNDLLISHVISGGEGASYWGGEAWHYDWQEDKVQTTAMAIKALIRSERISENPDILNKAIRWLMMQRHGGGWYNTQQTAFIVYTMVDYLKTSKELEPDYDVKVWVNGEQVLDKKMTREDVFLKEQTISIDGLKLKPGVNDVKIEKNGPGKVYVASHLMYYTNEEVIHPRENGFRVEKEYFKLEKYTKYNDDKIIYKKRYFDGSVKSGDEILVKVKVSTKENNMQYFMLEDPIPAGCEVVKDDWAYTIDEEKDYSGWDYYYWRWWYADKDIRDNRVTFFATYLYGDTYEFSYILHAQIPGIYNVIPATGMLMYYPEVRGSSEELRLTIED